MSRLGSSSLSGPSAPAATGIPIREANSAALKMICFNVFHGSFRVRLGYGADLRSNVAGEGLRMGIKFAPKDWVIKEDLVTIWQTAKIVGKPIDTRDSSWTRDAVQTPGCSQDQEGQRGR